MPTMPLSFEFALHDRERGALDASSEQPPVVRVDAPWSAAQIEAVFAQHREAWFAPDLQPYADNIAAVLAQERQLSRQWEGLPGTDHPSHWDGSAHSLDKAQPQRRAADRLAVWHPPIAWVMPLVRRRARSLQVRLPLAGSTAALQAMALHALPPGWRRHRVTVRIEIETRVYWGARGVRSNGSVAWKPCRRRGDGLSHRVELFVLDRGRPVEGTLDDHDLAPMLERRLAGGVGLLVAVPVLSFERPRRWRHAVSDWWQAVWLRIGWVRRDDRDPTFVHRLQLDEPFWNEATGAAAMKPRQWHRALRDGALLRPASAVAAAWQRAGAPPGRHAHLVLVHGGLSSARNAFEALLDASGRMPLWPGMPALDQVCTWRFEHDSFVSVRHNIERLVRWLQREVIRGASEGNLVLLAHSRGGNVVRFALPVLRQRFPGWRFSGVTAGAPHLGTQVFSRIGRRWTGLAALVGAVRQMTQGWLGREQLAQLVILERGLAYEVPPGFHDVEPEGVKRMARGRPHELPEGLWLWGSEWGLQGAAEGQGRVEGALWDWLVEDLGGAEVGGDGLVARESALCGRGLQDEGAHDASPVFHTQYFAHAPTREQIAQRVARLLDGDPSLRSG
jgi:hypothetical protein